MVLDEGRIPAIWADLSRQDAAAVHVPQTHLGLHIEAWFNVSDAGAYYAYDLANVLAGPFLGLYPPGTSIDGTLPVAMIRFANVQGVATGPEVLAHGSIDHSVDADGTWLLRLAGTAHNVEIGYLVTGCP